MIAHWMLIFACVIHLEVTRLERWTCDQKVTSSTRGRVAFRWLLLRWVTCLWTGEPSCYIANHKAFRLFWVGKSSTGLSGWGYGESNHLRLVIGGMISYGR